MTKPKSPFWPLPGNIFGAPLEHLPFNIPTEAFLKYFHWASKASYSSRDTNNLKAAPNFHKSQKKEDSYFLDEVSCINFFFIIISDIKQININLKIFVTAIRYPQSLACTINTGLSSVIKACSLPLWRQNSLWFDILHLIFVQYWHNRAYHVDSNLFLVLVQFEYYILFIIIGTIFCPNQSTGIISLYNSMKNNLNSVN